MNLLIAGCATTVTPTTTTLAEEQALIEQKNKMAEMLEAQKHAEETRKEYWWLDWLVRGAANFIPGSVAGR